jgi:alcohol dehydrogenase (quinone), cytochrome c subunit
MVRKHYFVAIFLVLSACTSTHPEQPPNKKQLISRGQQVFVEQCAECHQTDGSGYSHLYPRLAGNPIVTLHDPEPIINTVLYGQGSMQSFAEKISGDDIAAVLSYIRQAWGNDAPPVSPRQVH